MVWGRGEGTDLGEVREQLPVLRSFEIDQTSTIGAVLSVLF